jgi:predicted nucleotidyltransferase/DNA-binding XRE family transcriptional regulator
MSPADIIKQARRAAGISQRELAVRAGTSQPAIARYESGRAVPAIDTLERLLRSCGSNLVLEAQATDAPAGPRPLSPLARLLRARRRELLELLKREGATTPRIFGSVARGEERADSDIDLVVNLGPDASLLDLARLRREATDLLGVPVDVVTPEILKPAIRERMEVEAISL